MNCVFLGLSITSTWGNGHATTYRGLLKELSRRGHACTFLERDVPWYSANREFTTAPFCHIALYSSLEELRDRYTTMVKNADVVVVGSYVPDGIEVGRWAVATARHCKAFYDIDTPVTLQALRDGKCEYLSPELIPMYDLYLSFTGGPTLNYLERQLGSPCAKALYCSVDPTLYAQEKQTLKWDLAYLGTYASDRQLSMQRFLLDVATQDPAKLFVVAGPQYPPEIHWPESVERIDHLPAAEHRAFYNSQRFTLNLTRRDMILAGHSPSVRLFEAAACGTPIITDKWAGLRHFFQPGTEILPVSTTDEVISHLRMSEERRLEIGDRARRCVLKRHTAAIRAEEFELCVRAALEKLTVVRKATRALLRPSPAALV